MNRSTLRLIIWITGLITALIHLVLLSVLLGFFSPLFVLNGLGFLALLGALFFQFPFLEGRERQIHWAFIAYTLVTILAWVAIGDKSDPVGIFTKADEVILLLALWGHMRGS